jgi:hypothetical protein
MNVVIMNHVSRDLIKKFYSNTVCKNSYQVLKKSKVNYGTFQACFSKLECTNSINLRTERFYSKSSERKNDCPPFFKELLKAQPIYTSYCNLTDAEKIEVVLEQMINNALINHNKKIDSKWNLVKKWDNLKSLLTNEQFSMPDVDDVENLLYFLPRLQSPLFDYNPKNFSYANESELEWINYPPTIPTFKHNTTETDEVLDRLVIPHLTSGMLVRELGCWNGEALIKLAFKAKQKKIYLAGLEGVDVNEMSLQVGSAILKYFKIHQSIVLGRGNVLDVSSYKSNFSAKKQMILAFRLISCLDEKSISDFFSNLSKHTQKGDLACFTYPIPEGANFQNSLIYESKGKLRLDLIVGGQGGTFYNDNKIFQTYLTKQGYSSFLEKYSFEEIESRDFESEGSYRTGSLIIRK